MLGVTGTKANVRKAALEAVGSGVVYVMVTGEARERGC